MQDAYRASRYNPFVEPDFVGIAENYDIWDFELSDEEMAQIPSHDKGYSGSRAKHFEPSFVRMCLGKE